MNGVCVLRFLDNISEIMRETKAACLRKLHSPNAPEGACSIEELSSKLDDFELLFKAIDMSFSPDVEAIKETVDQSAKRRRKQP